MLTLSIHTERDMSSRGILRRFIEAVLAQPEWTAPDPQPGLTRSFGRVPESGGRYLRVVHRSDNTDTFIVTAHWDRGARKP